MVAWCNFISVSILLPDDYGLMSRVSRGQPQVPSYISAEEFTQFTESFDCTWKNVRLALIDQPEHQHRARYLTEGSRGPIKNRTFDGFPTIQVCLFEH